MKKPIGFKIESRHLVFVLVALGVVLIAMGAAGALGVRLPEKLASEISNGVIILALLVFMYNRKLRADEAKAAAEKGKNPQADMAETGDNDGAGKD